MVDLGKVSEGAACSYMVALALWSHEIFASLFSILIGVQEKKKLILIGLGGHFSISKTLLHGRELEFYLPNFMFKFALNFLLYN